MSAAIASNPPQPSLDSNLHRGGGLRRSSTLKRLSQWVWSGWAATPSNTSMTTTSATRSHNSHTAKSRSETVGLLRDVDGMILSHADNIASDCGRNFDTTTTSSTRVINGVSVSAATTDATSSEQQDSLQPLFRVPEQLAEPQDDSRMPTPCRTCRDWTLCDRIYPRCGHCRYEQVMCFYTSKDTTNRNNTLRRSGTTVTRSGSTTTTTTVKRKKRHSSFHPGLEVQAES